MNVEEVEQLIKEAPAESKDVFEESEEDQEIVDLHDAFFLLGKCRNLLNYVADPDLCKTFTKKEREAMERLSEKIKEYLDSVELSYED